MDENSKIEGRLSTEDAHRLFDTLMDTLSVEESLTPRQAFVGIFTTDIPDSYMLLDDLYRVFVLKPILDRGLLTFNVRANVLIADTVLDKLFAAEKALDDLALPVQG